MIRLKSLKCVFFLSFTENVLHKRAPGVDFDPSKSTDFVASKSAVEIIFMKRHLDLSVNVYVYMSCARVCGLHVLSPDGLVRPT